MFLLFLLLFSFSFAGDIEKSTSAAASSSSVINSVRSSSGLSSQMSNFTKPSSQINSLDNSSSVSISLKCPSSVSFLQVQYFPVAGHNIHVFIREDLNFDGEYDYTYEIDNVAGICATGLLFCNPGTVENCQYAPYRVDSSGKVFMGDLSPYDPNMSNTGVACYCINDACNAMSVTPEGVSKILDDVSGVVLSLISSVVDVAGIEVSKDISSFSVEISASKASSCYSTGDSSGDISRMRSYYQDGDDSALRSASEEVLSGEKDYPIAGSTSSFQKSYEFASNSPYITGNPPPNEKYCAIVTNAQVKLVYDGGCDFNYTCSGVEDNGDGTFKCYLPANESVKCGPAFNYYVCGRYHTETYICDDPCYKAYEDKNDDGVNSRDEEVWGNDCGTTDGDYDSFSGGYNGNTGNSLVRVYVYFRDDGGCGCPRRDGSPYNSSIFYVYIKDFPSYKVVNDCKVIENSSDDCTLDSEVMCEPDAVCTDFSSCANNPSCVFTVKGGSPTGARVSKTCKFLDGALTGTILCMNGDTVTTTDGQVLETGKDLYWKVYRKYICKNNNQYSYDIDLSRHKQTLESTKFDESSGQFSYNDLEGKASSGIIKNYSPDCQKYCRVLVHADNSNPKEGQLLSSKTPSDTPDASAHVKGDVDYVTYRKCENDVCPLKNGEQQLTECSCMSDQPADWRGLISLSAVYEASRDMICSSSPP